MGHPIRLTIPALIVGRQIDDEPHLSASDLTKARQIL